MWENYLLCFRMSPSYINAHWHFAGRTAKPPEMPHSIALGLTSRKHKARLTSQTKNIMFISGECWQPKHVTKGRVCKTVPLPLNPSYFLDRKKSVVSVVAGFLSCDKFPADPGTLPVVLLPAWGLCWLSGKHFVLPWPPRCQLSGCCVTRGAALCDLQRAGGAAVITTGILLLRSTACLDIGHGGSCLKVTFNKKQIKILHKQM